MTVQVLYVLAIPQDAREDERRQAQRNLSKQGMVSAGGQPTAESVSTNPKEMTLMGRYAGRYAETMALELEELFGSQSIDTVPFYKLDADDNRVQSPQDGYYSLEQVNQGQTDPRDQQKGAYEWDGRIVRQGTRKTHWRSIGTKIQDVTSANPFSSGGTDYVFAPTTAQNTQWFNPTDGSLEAATTSVSGRSGEFQDVDGYDPSDPSFDDPTLIYDQPYEDEGKADTKVWDSWGRTKDNVTRVSPTTKVGEANVSTESNGVTNTWGRVFDTSHDFRGRAVIENGIFRLSFDEDKPLLEALEWSSGDYSTVSLGASGWEFRDLDLVRCGDDRVEAQALFKNTSNQNIYYVDIILERGMDRAFFLEPENEGAMPSGLNTKLSPAAVDWDDDPTPERSIVKREDVRR